MSHSDHKDDHKHKKADLLKRNKHNQLVFEHAEQHADLVEAGGWGTPDFVGAPMAMPSRGSAEAELVSRNVALVRNRITGRKAAAAERWNRFAGTSGGGGRGR